MSHSICPYEAASRRAAPGPPGTTSVGLQQALSEVAQWTRFPSSALESDWPQDFGAFTAYDWWRVAFWRAWALSPARLFYRWN